MDRHGATEEVRAGPAAGTGLTPTRWPTDPNDPAGARFLRLGEGAALGVPRMAGPAPGVAYASFAWRAVGLAVDLVVGSFVLGTVNQVGLSLQYAAGGPGPGPAVVQEGVGVLVAVVGFALAWTAVRASPGQFVAGLRTLRRVDGRRLGFGPALARAVLLFGPWLAASVGPSILQLLQTPSFGYTSVSPGAAGAVIALGALVWYVLLAWSALENPRGQGWHDTICGSVVIGPAG